MMNSANLFANLMQVLWDCPQGNEPLHTNVVIRAVVSYVRSHNKRNHENALDVLDIAFPDAKLSARLPHYVGATPSEVLYDVVFDDGSTAIIETCAGIGNGVEPTSDSTMERELRDAKAVLLDNAIGHKKPAGVVAGGVVPVMTVLGGQSDLPVV